MTRQANAPLEVVLTLPVLVGLLAILMWLGRYGSAKIAATSDARTVAWSASVPEESELAMSLDAPPGDGISDGFSDRSVSGPFLYRGLPTSVRSKAYAATNPWAHEAFPFEDLPVAKTEIRMHTVELNRLITANHRRLGKISSLAAPLNNLKTLDPERRPELKRATDEIGRNQNGVRDAMEILQLNQP